VKNDALLRRRGRRLQARCASSIRLCPRTALLECKALPRRSLDGSCADKLRLQVELVERLHGGKCAMVIPSRRAWRCLESTSPRRSSRGSRDRSARRGRPREQRVEALDQCRETRRARLSTRARGDALIAHLRGPRPRSPRGYGRGAFEGARGGLLLGAAAMRARGPGSARSRSRWCAARWCARGWRPALPAVDADLAFADEHLDLGAHEPVGTL